MKTDAGASASICVSLLHTKLIAPLNFKVIPHFDRSLVPVISVLKSYGCG